MHLKRWITSLFAIPIIFLTIYYGGRNLFTAAIGCVSILSLREYFRFYFDPQGIRQNIAIIIVGYISTFLIVLSAHLIRFDYMFLSLIFNLLSCGFIGLFLFKSMPSLPETITKQITGLIYIPALLSFLVLIRSQSQGVIWIFFLLCLVAAGDIGAFYAGTFLGKHKLCPSVSPKKTIEGSLGGLCANIFVGLIFKFFFFKSDPFLPFLVFSVTVGMAGQVGDLFESILKRAANIKDSGTLLPGHGGMLDRVDALMFAAPLAYFLKGHIF